MSVRPPAFSIIPRSGIHRNRLHNKETQQFYHFEKSKLPDKVSIDHHRPVRPLDTHMLGSTPPCITSTPVPAYSNYT